MDAILTDLHLDTRIKKCILVNMIEKNIRVHNAREGWDGNAKFVKQLETVQITAAKKDTTHSESKQERVNLK